MRSGAYEPNSARASFNVRHNAMEKSRSCERELLAGAGREQHGGVDALEVHVGDARLGVVHARAHRRRRPELEVVVGPGGRGGIVVVHLHPAAGHVAPGDAVVVLQRAHVLDHLRAEPVGNAPPPVERLAAVPVGVDHLEPVATHASVTGRPVDHVAQVVAPHVTIEVVGEELEQRLLVPVLRRRRVRGDEDVRRVPERIVGRERFGARDVEDRGGEVTLLE